MSYQKEIDKYIGKHKNLIGKLMRISSKDISTSDLRIFANFLSYRAGERHFHDNGGKVDPRFLDDIRLKSRELKGPKALLDAILWYERGTLTRGSLSKLFKEQNKFSPKIEKYLESRRKENHKKAFENIAMSVNSLRKTVPELTKLMNDKRPSSDKTYIRDLRAVMKKLRGDLSRCDYHARAGVAWAVKIGIPYSHARKGIEEVYLKHLDINNFPGISGARTEEDRPTLAQYLAPLDDFLETQGIKSSISKSINKRAKDWKEDLDAAGLELEYQNRTLDNQRKRVFNNSRDSALTI